MRARPSARARRPPSSTHLLPLIAHARHACDYRRDQPRDTVIAASFNCQAWAPEEDHIILEMHKAEGPKWSKIVQRLPNRTVSSVRNRWQRIEKGRKLREDGVESKNRCHACGLPKRGHVCYAKMRGGPQVRSHRAAARARTHARAGRMSPSLHVNARSTWRTRSSPT